MVENTNLIEDPNALDTGQAGKFIGANEVKPDLKHQFEPT